MYAQLSMFQPRWEQRASRPLYKYHTTESSHKETCRKAVVPCLTLLKENGKKLQSIYRFVLGTVATQQRTRADSANRATLVMAREITLLV